jgi:hypothetical protein
MDSEGLRAPQPTPDRSLGQDLRPAGAGSPSTNLATIVRPGPPAQLSPRNLVSPAAFQPWVAPAAWTGLQAAALGLAMLSQPWALVFLLPAAVALYGWLTRRHRGSPALFLMTALAAAFNIFLWQAHPGGPVALFIVLYFYSIAAGLAMTGVSLDAEIRSRRESYVVLDASSTQGLPKSLTQPLLASLSTTARRLGYPARQLGLILTAETRNGRVVLRSELYDRDAGSLLAAAHAEGDPADRRGLAADLHRRLLRSLTVGPVQPALGASSAR